MTTKVQLRAGSVEFSFESDSPIAVSDVKDFIAQVQDLAKSVGPVVPSEARAVRVQEVAEPRLLIEDNALKLHVNSVADRLGAKTGADVALAASAFLQIVERKESFTRRELLDTMKNATNYFNQNIGSNLTSIIKSLLGIKWNQLANDSYALKSGEITTLRGKLAE